MSELAKRLRIPVDQQDDWIIGADKLKEEAATELERLEQAFKVACQNIVALNEQREMLKAALGSALNLIDQLLTDLRLAGGTPSQNLLLAKGKLDIAMKKLIPDLD